MGIDEKQPLSSAQQPTYQQPQHAVVGQPVHMAQPMLTDWSYGLCDCMQDMGICCDVCWCGLCVLSRQCESIVNNNQDSFSGVVCCGLFLANVFIGGASTCLFSWVMRDKARHKYNIEGNGCKDCCAVTFCNACVVCQIQRETLRRGDNPGYCCCSPSNPPVKIQTGVPAQQGYVPAYPPQQQAAAYPPPQAGAYPPPPGPVACPPPQV